MTLESLGNLGEFLGGLAVLVSLVYLAFQIRQNTQMLKASALSATTETYVAFNHLLGADAAAAHVFQVGLEDFASLSEDGQRQFLNLLRAAFASYEHVFQNYEAGLLDREVWDRHVRGIKQVLELPHISVWWEMRKDSYVPSFVTALEQAPKAPPVPLAEEVIRAMIENARPKRSTPER